MIDILVGALVALAPTDSDPAQPVPAAVTSWFAASGPAAVDGFLGTDADWRADLIGSGSNTVTLGTPVPQLAVAVPAFDLTKDAVSPSGTGTGADAVQATNTYCARVVVNGAQADAILCADLKAGTVTPDGLDEVFFQPDAGPLPRAGVVRLSSGTFGNDGGTFRPLDAPAHYNVPSATVRRADLLAALGKRQAERAAISRIEGPRVGGEPPLLRPEGVDDHGWDALVARGLAVPDAQAWHDTGDQHASGPSTGTVTLLGVLGLMALLMAGAWRAAGRPARRQVA